MIHEKFQVGGLRDGKTVVRGVHMPLHRRRSFGGLVDVDELQAKILEQVLVEAQIGLATANDPSLLSQSIPRYQTNGEYSQSDPKNTLSLHLTPFSFCRTGPLPFGPC